MVDTSTNNIEYTDKELKKHTIRGVFWKISERVVAQGISLVVSIILARLLTPDDYSVVSIVTIFFTFANLFISSGLNTALIQKKDADVVDYSSVLHVSVLLSIVLYVVLFLCAPYIANAYNKDILIPVVRVMGITLIINAVKSITCAYMSNKLEFKKFFFATLGGTVVSAFVGIWMALNGYGAWALVAQQMTNSVIDTIILFASTRIKIILKIDFGRLKSLFTFGWKIFVASVFTTIYDELNPLIIGLKFSTADLAFYSKGKSFPAVIDSTISNTFSAVLFPVMAKVQDDENKIRAYTRKFIKICSFLVFPLMFGFLAISDNFINLLLTEKWSEAAFYLKVFAFVSAFNIITTANLQAIRSMGRSDIILKLELVKKITYFIVIIVFVMISATPHMLVLAVLINNVVSIVCNTFPNRKLIGYRYRDQFNDLILNFVSAIMMAGCVYTMNFLPINKIVLLLLQLIIGVLIYVGICILTKNENYYYLMSEIEKIIGKRTFKVLLYNLIPTSVRDKFHELNFKHSIKKVNKRKAGRAKVAFIVLFGANWNSYKTVYENLSQNDKVECQLYIMPRIVKDRIADMEEYDENCKYFLALYSEAKPLYDVKSMTWKHLEYDYDYVFYDEPYHNSYKKEYCAKTLYKNSKICYVPYAFQTANTKRLIDGTYNMDFFRYCYMFYSPNHFITERVHYLYRNTKEQYHHVFELGFPRFDEKVIYCKPDEFKVLWIPRFSVSGMRYEDPTEITSFFDYKDLVLASQFKFILRPHPLAFSKYIQYGVMSEDDVNQYKEKVNQSDMVEFDIDKNYNSAFRNSNVMLADFSSLIVEYVFANKPVIYCGDIQAIADPILREALYVENDWSRICKIIEGIKNGDDPLEEKRKEYIKSLHADDCYAGKRICQTIINDFYNEEGSVYTNE